MNAPMALAIGLEFDRLVEGGGLGPLLHTKKKKKLPEHVQLLVHSLIE
jgi:hypothetical protein